MVLLFRLNRFLHNLTLPQGVVFRASIRRRVFVEGRPVVGLNYIYVPEHLRGKGLATSIMTDFCSWSDKNNVFLVLSPGTSNMSRLILFYQRFGFVQATVPIKGIVENSRWLMHRTPLK